MSTLPGQASKGEKTKQKFQSLDINNLYNRLSRGENPEKQQQKTSSTFIKHGMQSLGKVPSARRAPANLPSLKSEHSGTDAAVPLVPPGAQGWGKHDSSTSSANTTSPPATTPTTTISQNSSLTTAPLNQQPSSPPQLSAHQAAIALPVTNPVPHTHKQSQLSAQTAPTDKLWSSVTSGYQDGVAGGGTHPPLYHSPQFQHEFPSLSSGDGGPMRTGLDALPYPTVAGGPPVTAAGGLSLRPQTEGSWTQGGQRGTSNIAGDASGGQARPATAAHLGGPPQLPPQVGLQVHQQPFPPQIKGVMPSFMYKGSSFQQGPGIGIQNQNTSAPPPVPPASGRSAPRPMENRPPRLMDREQGDEVLSRPIIREEELNRMDEIGKDAGWAESDEIDFNEKLDFSGDESEKPSRREPMKRHQQSRDHKDERFDNHSDSQQRQWNTGRSSNTRGRSSEEEDIWMQRRNQTDKQVEIAVQRAKQRKEEEEKRFNEERKQGSAKKLMELEEKIQKRDKDNQEGVGTINPNTIPPKPINPVEIPLPSFQKDKERDKDSHRDREQRSRTPSDTTDDRNRHQSQESSFRQLTQIESKNFPPRKHQKPNERDQRDRDRDMRDQNGPSFSRSFQHDLPPRFKQQRNNTNVNVPNQQFHQFERGWNQNVSKPQQSSTGQFNQQSMHNRNVRHSPDIEKEDDDRREYKRQSSEDSYRSSHHSQQDLIQKPTDSQRYHEDNLTRLSNYELQYSRKEQDEDKRQKDNLRHHDKDQDDHNIGRSSGDDWGDRREKIREEKPIEKHDRDRDRPQRPDSRDSRSTRHSRDSEPRDYMGSCSESYESTYEEKRRDHHVREDRRVVPGPITKDRIEADDLKNEKRNLTQLKRGQVFEVKVEKKEEQTETKKEELFASAWADVVHLAIEDAESAKLADDKKASETRKVLDAKTSNEANKRSDRNDDYGRNRSYSKKPGSDYHPSRSQAWPKRSSSRGQRSNRGNHGTDSEGSTEEHSLDQKNVAKNESQKAGQRSPKLNRNFDKDEKNRDNNQEKFVNDQRKYEKPEKRDNYVPKGEPSRHGRGGGNFRSGRGGLSKRIDGYGPPPSKSPFGHHDDRDKDKKIDDHQQLESHPAPTEDKTKQNQQALAAGIAGKRNDPVQGYDRGRTKPDNRVRTGRPRGKDEFCDTNSENSDEKNRDTRKMDTRKVQPRNSMSRPRTTQPPRMGGDKRGYDAPRQDNSSQQNFNNALKKDDIKPIDQSTHANVGDSTLKNKDDVEIEDKEEKTSMNGDTEGFQEVKSKKTAVKERQKPIDEKSTKPVLKTEIIKEPPKVDRDRKPNKNFSSQQLTQLQIQNIPSLMATPVNPPQVLPKPKSNSLSRDRQNNLAPRFAKQKLKAAQLQQHQMHTFSDMNDLNKTNQSIGMYSMMETNVPVQSVTTCAWDKPLSSQLRNMESESMLGVSIEPVKSLERVHSNSQGNSPNNEKMMNKPTQLQDKTLLDGTTPPVNTIIFENTNFKSTPGNRSNRNEKPRSKLEDSNMDSSVMVGLNKPSMNELLQNKSEKSDNIQIPLFKEDNSDMKLDFFGSDLQFTDDKKNLCISSKAIHAITSGNNTVDTLDIKIASVKKVWETSEQEGEDSQMTFGGPPLDPNVFTQGKDTPDDNHEGYSPAPNQSVSTTTNVCKVKPTQQVSGGGQTVLNSTNHQPHSGIVTTGLMGNPLSPPPMQPVLGANVGIGPQQFPANQHIGYQASLSGSTQYGISAIPSPPTVPLVYNSTQPLQAAAAQTPVPYGAYQIDGVLGGQGRNQFSQFPSYHSLGQTASSPYSTQSVYLQTPPHPPTAQAPPELYSNINNYRMSATAQFGQNQQLNNPTTVLISSTSNSLMSASVKPSNQPISAIGTYLSDLSLGTKAGGVGQAYQQQSQQGQQLYMTYEPAIQANYLTPSASVIQRGPAGPVQNNVVPTLQPSSSFYSGSTGAQTGYFQQPGSSTIPSAQLQQHQAASFSLPGNLFGTPNQSHTNTGLQNFNSHFLTTPIQMAALNAQQFRSGLPAAYMKGVNNPIGDQASRAQQLKSPSSQEVLSSVFNTGPQIPSPKSRQNPKHPPPQSSPTAQHKYNLYSGIGGQQNQNVQRYPTPIQRPVNFQQMQGNVLNQKHRNNSNNKAPNRQYYGGQNNSLSVQNEKTEDSKIPENVSLSSANAASSANKTATIGTSSANSVNSSSEKVKDNIKEETATLKE